MTVKRMRDPAKGQAAAEGMAAARFRTCAGVAARLDRLRPPAAAPAPASATHTILVVDDHKAIREIFARHLRERGYNVLEAGGPLQAQWMASVRGGIDLLLTDFCMPGMNGVQLAQWFHDQIPGCKVLLTSAAPWEVGPYLTEPHNLVLMAKKDASSRLAGIVHELLEGCADGAAQHDSKGVRKCPPSPNPGNEAEACANLAQPGCGYETGVLCEVD
jgi:CheY-like chemotaxis protein